jgi:shikimate kinase
VVKSTLEKAPKSNNNQIVEAKLNRRKQGSKGSTATRQKSSLRAVDSAFARRLPQALILVGFMGAGKSTIGALVAERLGWAFEDLDERIEKRQRRKIADVFRNSGEAEFRKLESAALEEVLYELRAGSGKVIALGGGAFAQESNVQRIEAAKIRTVFLDAEIGELWQRCQTQSEREGIERPLLMSREDFQRLYEQRRTHYLKASLRHSTSAKSVEQISAELMKAFELIPGHKNRGQKR